MEIYQKQSFAESFRVYLDRRMLRILLLGIISGFPWVLIGSSLSLWLKEEGLSRSTIGWAGLIFAVYAFNYLWAPLIDRIRIPWLTNKVGHRRGWIIIMQLIIEVHDIDGRLDHIVKMLKNKNYTVDVLKEASLKDTSLYNVYARR